MKSLIGKAGLIAFAVWATFAGNAFAWGEDGHRSVCRIAFLLLDDAQQDEITRLTAEYVRPDGKKIASFPDACVFPDEARANGRKGMPDWKRFGEFDNWHFLNVPRTRIAIEEADCANDCVLKGIAHHSAVLHDADNDHDRAEALFFLGHWLGDVHQPLHVSYADDRGGNNVQPIKGGFYTKPTDEFPTSLHSVWDSKIIQKAEGKAGWRAYAHRLEKKITPAAEALWRTPLPLEWAQESYVLATLPATDYCQWSMTTTDSCDSETQVRTLGAAYQALFQDDVETRLQQAGVRLAERIRQNLPMPMASATSTSDVTVIGKLTIEGVECRALREDGTGKLFTLTGDLKGFTTGDHVKVVGSVAEISICQQGTTISVTSIARQ